MAPKYEKKIFESGERKNPRNSISWNPLVTPAQKLVAHPAYARIDTVAAIKMWLCHEIVSPFTFSHWANKLRVLIERQCKLKSEIENEK